MVRLKLILQYDGTAYNGWQRQKNPNLRTIQGVVEQSLTTIYQESIEVVAAGRTDRGVHAQGQVVAFDATKALPTAGLLKAMNNSLPPDVAVLSVSEVEDGFHPRYNSKGKWYRYTIYNNPVPDVFMRNYSLHIPYKLDREAMVAAGKYFCGTHNFRGFCSSHTGVKTYQRVVEKCSVSWEGDYIYLDCVANGFLYNMVRIIAGTLLECGRGKIKPEEIPAIIASQRRAAAGPTAPPQGLCLKKVYF